MDIGTVFWSAISSTALIGFAAWLARNLIVTRLTAAVRHEFDAKLAAINTEHKQTELQFEARLRYEQSRIEALSSGALASVSNRQAEVLRRKLLAIDQLWTAFLALGHGRIAAQLITSMNYEKMAELAAKDEGVRAPFKAMAIDMKALHSPDGPKARPFVSELAWGLFSAYSAVTSVAALKVKMLELGIKGPITDDEKVLNLVKAALPHRADYIDKHGMFGTTVHLLSEMETGLLAEFRTMLSGAAENKDSVKQAAQIRELAESVEIDVNKAVEEQKL